MINSTEIIPFENETPSSYAERLSLIVSGRKSAVEKRKIGQYFTPAETARLMASFSSGMEELSSVSILDPGAGTAVLSCALIEKLSESRQLKEIKLVCYETDTHVIPYTRMSLGYLERTLSLSGIKLSCSLCEKSFPEDKNHFFEQKGNQRPGEFDIIISNPPYFKMHHDDVILKEAGSILHGQPNIYSIFIYIASHLLKDEGELIFLIPGSFCSGGFFARFRRELLKRVQLVHIHSLLNERRIFEEESLLTEPVIVKAVRKRSNDLSYLLNTSASGGESVQPAFHYSYLFSPDENIIRRPLSGQDMEAMDRVLSFKGSFASYGLKIFAGRFMLSRAAGKVSDLPPGDNNALLIRRNTAETGPFSYSSEMKREFVQADETHKEGIIPNQNYVILPRYRKGISGKGLMASPWLKQFYPGELLAVDHKLDYIARPDGGLKEREAEAISKILNSSLYERYIRIINGSINASSSLIEKLPLPELHKVNEMPELL